MICFTNIHKPLAALSVDANNVNKCSCVLHKNGFRYSQTLYSICQQHTGIQKSQQSDTLQPYMQYMPVYIRQQLYTPAIEVKYAVEYTAVHSNSTHISQSSSVLYIQALHKTHRAMILEMRMTVASNHATRYPVQISISPQQ